MATQEWIETLTNDLVRAAAEGHDALSRELWRGHCTTGTDYDQQLHASALAGVIGRDRDALRALVADGERAAAEACGARHQDATAATLRWRARMLAYCAIPSNPPEYVLVPQTYPAARRGDSSPWGSGG